MNRPRPATLIGFLVLFLFAAGITIASFFSLVIPEFRHQAFYAGLIASCIAELVLFGYMAYVIGAKSSPGHPDLANRARLMLLVVLWAVFVVGAGAYAANPANADTFASDKVILIKLTVTFLFLLTMFMQHRQATAIQLRDAAPQQDRRRLECCAGGLDNLLGELRELAGRKPEHAVALDSLAKRIDTLKTLLLAVSAAGVRDQGRPAEPTESAVIEQRLLAAHDAVSKVPVADDRRIAEQLQVAKLAVDGALTALRQRENAVTF